MRKKIVVFGGSGFLGSHVADFLTSKNYQVLIYDKVKSDYISSGQNFIQGDILDKNLVQFNSSGLMWAFGVDYKLTHKWHIESGYHVFTTEDVDYSRIVLSLSRHFKTIND